MFTAIEELEFVIEPQIRGFCGPLFFARSLESAKGNITANGTYGLIDTGEKKLLFTCQHVGRIWTLSLTSSPRPSGERAGGEGI
jgi:hypothetical protein